MATLKQIRAAAKAIGLDPSTVEIKRQKWGWEGSFVAPTRFTRTARTKGIVSDILLDHILRRKPRS